MIAFPLYTLTFQVNESFVSEIKIPTLTELVSKSNGTASPNSPLIEYPRTENPGFVVIVNVENFKNNWLKTRTGSSLDASNLKETFVHHLRYENLEIPIDLTAKVSQFFNYARNGATQYQTPSQLSFVRIEYRKNKYITIP